VTSGRPARVVVLPFENLGPPEDAYFAAGITEEIIGRLANLKGLTVISRTTAIGYDRRGKTIRKIGDELDVDFVLEGTVKWEHAPGTAGRVRISPQLIQVADDAHVWGDRFDRTAADVFAIESEVGEAVARAAGLRLVPREEAALKATSTKDMEAFDLYLRGLAIASRSQTKRDQEEALSLFGAAVARDPSFSQALAMLARTHLFIHFLKLDASPEHVERAKDAVAKLEALGPDLAETHVARAYLDYWALFDLPNARDEFQAALTQQPSNADAVLGLAYVLRRQGLWEQAASQMSKLVELDPRNPTVLFQYGNTCMLLRRYDQAERLWKSSAVLYPQSGNAWGRRAWLQVLAKGDVRAARAVLADARTVGALVDDSDWLALASFRVALATKDYDAALELLGAPGRTAFSNNFVYLPAALLRGEVLTLTGHAQDARAAFEAARRDLAERAAASPDDARYQGALGFACAGLGLAEEALKAARRGVELMPATKDSWVGCWRLEELALVEAFLGKKDDALAHLGELLARTGELTPHVLRLDPRWEPLRADPRFAELLSRS
jgi:TolB-like protein/Flp pilus assembly protein TadD